jgi:hypothetical protein
LITKSLTGGGSGTASGNTDLIGEAKLLENISLYSILEFSVAIGISWNLPVVKYSLKGIGQIQTTQTFPNIALSDIIQGSLIG